MEALNSALLGVLRSLLRKLDELPSTEDGARQLREDLGSIRTKLEMLSEVHDPPHTVSYWLKDARELSYDMEDFLDHFIHASGADAKTDRVNQLISGFKTRVDELRERYNRYNLEYVLGRTTNTLASHRLLVVRGREPHPVVLVGIDGPANEILQWLKPKGDDREKQLKVVSIHGVEGVGKTTLAQKLWRELEADFKYRAFIQTAKKPDMRMILTNILSQVRPEQPPENFQVSNLIQHIRKHLQDKRYFIVIDDLWTVSVWDVLSRAFPDSNCFGRIVITSTTEDIALACCSYDPEYIFRMKPLSEDRSKRLFICTAFGSENGCPPQVSDNLDEITRKCCGLPLALICLAAVVASLSETEQQLEYFKFLRNNLRTNSTTVEVMNQVLKLCYNSLPYSLKTCLLYLSVYPVSYTIVKEDLVKQWIAEGFICTLDGKDIEEVARSYFDELVNLNLIQRMDISNRDKKRVPYRVHPMVHYFITCNSMKDNFVTTLDYTQSTVVLIDKIRRLALHFGSATYATTPASTGLWQVRSFAFMGLMSCTPSLGEFKLVRVIILHFQDDHGEVSEEKDDHGDTTFSLTEIRNLFLLRYLQVRCSVTVILPDRVQCLQHLETLEINAIVVAVPSDIVNHPSLKHVRLGRKNKHNHLTVGPDTASDAVFLNVSGTIFSASLQKLELLPPICNFSRLPAWIQQLHGLRILEIVVRELGMYDLEFLSELTFLTALSMYVRKPTAGRAVTFRGGAFPVLKYLKLVTGVLLLSFREKSVCSLEKLKIGFNTHRGENRGQKLGGIHHLLKLQLIVASIGAATGAEESDRIAAESVLRDAISKHPCHPRFKVKRVEPFDEERDPSKIQIWSQEAESSSAHIYFPTVQKKHSEIEDLPAEDSTRIPASVPPGVKELAAGPRTSSAAAYELGRSSTDLDALLEKLGGLLELGHALLSDVHWDIRLIHRCESNGYLDSQSKDWFNDCRELALDIEDLVDLCTLCIDTEATSSENEGLLTRIRRKFKTFSRLREIFRNLEKLKRRVVEQNERLQRGSIPGELPGGPMIRSRFDDGNFVNTSRISTYELVGMAGPKEEVSKMVMEAGDDKAERKIISIVGMAGSGKTTLANEVCFELRRQGYFQHSALMSVGQKLEDRFSETVEYMLSLFNNRHQRHNSHEYDNDIDQLIGRLREQLKDKRYLIVVDDLWRMEQWETIKRCFPENKLGSRIIITTRNTALAMHCSSRSSDCVYKIRLLSDTDSKSLFLRRVCGTGERCPDHLEAVSAQIIRRCGGLPLALINAASSLLKYSPASLQEKWKRNICMNFLSSSAGKYMMQILSLSYNDLSPSLKTCMLYLSIFPEHYEVDTDRLMRLWIAEGFVMTPGVSAEKSARSYLVELIDRNIVQPLPLKRNGIPRYCRVHAVMHDFIVYKSIEENFVTLVDAQSQDAPTTSSKKKDAPTNNGTVRRLSYQSSSNRDQDGAQIVFAADLSHARSITVFGQSNAAPLLTKLRVVRVLDLDGCRGPVCLDGLHKLLLLRYLSLRGTDVNELPKKIGELKYLETLDVRSTNVKELPASIVRLEKLMHLLSGSAKLPYGISKMKALQTLSCAIVTNDWTRMVKELSELADLRELDLSCDLTEVPGDGKHVEFPVDGFQGLRQLCIQGSLPSVTFEPSVLPMVETLELKFKRCITEESGGIFGVENLMSLKHVLLEFSQHDASAMAIVDTVREAASTAHPNHPEVTVIVDGRTLD